MLASRLIIAAGVLGALAASVYFAPYARNYLAFSISDPDRILDADKYAPQEAVAGGKTAPLPEQTGRIATAAADRLDAIATETESFALIAAQGDTIVYHYVDDGIDLDETLFDSYSIHKGLLSVAFGYALETGAIDSLDQPAADFLPEWRDDERAQITIRDLLSNQSGLAQATFAQRPFNPVLDLFIGRDLHKLTFERPLDFPPDTAFDFNHINAQALYFVLTRATGRRYADILSDYLWTPLGNETGFVALDGRQGDARTICCFLGTATSWLRFGLMLANGGKWNGEQVVSPNWLETLRTPVSRNPNSGFSLWLVEPHSGKRLQSEPRGLSREITGPFLAPDTFFFEASGNGRIYVIPSLEISIIRFGRLRGPWVPFDDAAIVNTVVTGLAETADQRREEAL